MRLEGEIALITGAARGIGAAIAERFAAEGAAVLVVDVNRVAGEELVHKIRKVGGKASFIAADISQESAVAEMAEQAAQAFGPPSILVNNAGVAVFDTPVNLSIADWRRCMAVDLDGAWLCARALLPAMIEKQHGAIVNVASVHSFQVLRGAFPYGVAKHGIVGLTRALSIEYAANGIRVNAVCPGYIDTPILRDNLVGHPDPEGFTQYTTQLHPPKRYGRPEEVASAVLFLASSEAGFVNGASLMVDGGRSLVYHDDYPG
jgi:NAD(P)-dependent dehydrogenase (short-subunit alcohol dehydrogenase family)